MNIKSSSSSLVVVLSEVTQLSVEICNKTEVFSPTLSELEVSGKNSKVREVAC